jgi:galactokinase
VADTQVKHDIGGEGYPLRRKQSEAAAKKLGVGALRDITERELADAAAAGRLAGKELMRARHVVSEIARTLQAVEALEAGDYVLFGELMYASHESLREDYEVSCEELNAVVELAEGCEGAYGARMTGGGFGGCAIILAGAQEAEAVSETVAAGFADRFGRRCPIFPTRACAGAGILRV